MSSSSAPAIALRSVSRRRGCTIGEEAEEDEEDRSISLVGRGGDAGERVPTDGERRRRHKGRERGPAAAGRMRQAVTGHST